MDTGDLWKIILLAVCLVLSALFSGSETAFIALSRVRLMHLLKTGKPGAGRVSRLIERPEKLLATVLLGNNLVNTAAAALATALAISLIDNSSLAILAATLTVTLTLLMFGETLPKTLAWRRPEAVAFGVARILVLVGWVMAPAVRFLQWFSLLAHRAFGVSEAHPEVTEEEIRTMISLGAQEGAVEPEEAELLEKVFHFGDRQVKEIMTPRTDIVWVERDIPIDEFVRIYRNATHTRFPVYEGDMENVVGILSVRDLLPSIAENGRGSGPPLADVLRPAYFVPETKLIGQLFSELRQEGQQMAIVIDQYGGVAGLVTLMQLIEVIVGPVGEEGEPAREEFAAIGENLFEADAGMGIQEANEEMQLDLPEGDYQTLAGFILERLGHIPHKGEVLYYGDLCLEVMEMSMSQRKIKRVQVRRIGRPSEPSP